MKIVSHRLSGIARRAVKGHRSRNTFLASRRRQEKNGRRKSESNDVGSGNGRTWTRLLCFSVRGAGLVGKCGIGRANYTFSPPLFLNCIFSTDSVTCYSLEFLHILKLKCTKFDFGWGAAPDPTWLDFSGLGRGERI